MDDAAFHALPNADRIAYRALKNALSELGEMVKTLPREVTDRHPDVDWRGFAGLRDIVAHGYFGLRQDLLWPIVRGEVPRLLASVEAESVVSNSDPGSHRHNIISNIIGLAGR